ncbi:unnamed protein product [Strongylus vulgaris]|uniref:Uncharacterized protein n=1 Tax=Strongylus vulgaris TaxID=40348 RepID=A0A3P7IPZ8_STRVU|nr:unnamed protein product [Strongylus vulgaris]
MPAPSDTDTDVPVPNSSDVLVVSPLSTVVVAVLVLPEVPWSDVVSDPVSRMAVEALSLLGPTAVEAPSLLGAIAVETSDFPDSSLE